jgi:large conductance mechanosensitive channel
VAFVMFMIIKGINKMKKKEEAAPEAPKGPTQEDLLIEIRDLLSKK